MAIEIITLHDALPDGFERLRAAARAEGIRNMDSLHDDVVGGAAFTSPGALFAALVDGRLVGVGGVSEQAGLETRAMRVRRLYVLPDARRLGAGRRLAEAMIAHGLRFVSRLTCNARASDAAAPFWEAMGFVPVSPEAGFTHELRL